MVMFRAPEKMRGADGLHWGLVSNLKRIMAHEPQIWCEPLKFEWQARRRRYILTQYHIAHTFPSWLEEMGRRSRYIT